MTMGVAVAAIMRGSSITPALLAFVGTRIVPVRRATRNTTHVRLGLGWVLGIPVTVFGGEDDVRSTDQHAGRQDGGKDAFHG